MTKFTLAESKAINAAWQEIRELCTRTNWTDSGVWREAEKLARKQAPSGSQQAGTWARAMICKQWLEGLENPDIAVRKIYWIREGALMAFLLGVRHAVERADTEYNGPMVERARELCHAAIAANESHTARILSEGEKAIGG